MSTDAVWITGVGLCTPCGHDLSTVAECLFSGRSAITRVSRFDVSAHPSQMAASVESIPITKLQRPGDSPTERAALWCCEQAIRSSGHSGTIDSLRVGLVLGVGSEWILGWESRGTDSDAIRPSPAVETVRSRLGLTGPAVTVSAACASGNHAFALARAWLHAGVVDVCLAGGCDMAVTPLTLAAFGNLRATSRRNDDPAGACRPFDRDRDGFVVAEGGVVCVMERSNRARRRGVEPLAELAGFAATSDAHHLVIPSPDPVAASRAIAGALRDARINVDEIGYVKAHGTGTSVGDIVESAALRSVLGVAAETTPVSSIKATSGHLLCAAATFEAVAGIIAMQRGIIPPTLNLHEPDTECRLDHVALRPREARVDCVLSNSFGFGGSNTAIVLRRAA